MIKPTPRRAAPLVLAVALAVTATTAATAAAAPAPSFPGPGPGLAGVQGWARMAYGDPRDDVRILVDAHGLFAGRADGRDPAVAARSWGTFRIQHYMGGPPDGERPAFNWGTSGSTAYASRVPTWP